MPQSALVCYWSRARLSLVAERYNVMARNGFVPVETQGQDIERDDDASMDGDIFDSADDIFDGENEDDSDGEGVFADNASVFSSSRSASVDHSNALTTREMEARRYEDAKPPKVLPSARKVYDARAGFKGKPKVKHILVAKFNDQGRPVVAHFAGNKQLEPFRAPTQKEHDALRTKGRLVQGGVGQVAPDGSIAPAASGSAFPWKKVLVGSGAAVVAGGLAWYFWKKRKNAADTVVEQVAESAGVLGAAADEQADDESED